MKNITLFILIILVSGNVMAQNVGIGTVTPGEKLDVNGNVNVSGQLKVNNNAGTSGQVLMKDASNNPVWSDLSEFKNMVMFDCPNYVASGSSNNCSSTWTVPAGVTKIVVECWGGGGGGGFWTGGGGGGYITAKITVTPAAVANLQIGAGGNYALLFASDGVTGGTTTFSIGGASISAKGGAGGPYGIVSASTSFPPPPGGDFSVSGITDNYFGLYGSPGEGTKVNYTQVSATEFAQFINFGNGGDAPLLPGSGGRGGYRMNASVSQNIGASNNAVQPGGGGGADASQGWYGKGGRIIIHY